MKIPEDKLPLKIHGIGKKQNYGQYTISYNENLLGKNYTGYKYAGRIASKDLSQYVVEASNKFPEAIKMLKELYQLIRTEGYHHSKVKEFLEEIEDA